MFDSSYALGAVLLFTVSVFSFTLFVGRGSIRKRLGVGKVGGMGGKGVRNVLESKRERDPELESPRVEEEEEEELAAPIQKNEAKSLATSISPPSTPALPATAVPDSPCSALPQSYSPQISPASSTTTSPSFSASDSTVSPTMRPESLSASTEIAPSTLAPASTTKVVATTNSTLPPTTVSATTTAAIPPTKTTTPAAGKAVLTTTTTTTNKKMFDRNTLLRMRSSTTRKAPPRSVQALIHKSSSLPNIQQALPPRQQNGNRGSRHHRSRSNNNNRVRKPPVFVSTSAGLEAEVKKQVQTTLNKLTPDNFDTLSKRLSEIGYTRAEQQEEGQGAVTALRVIVDLIVETALSNPFHNECYADLAAYLAVQWPPVVKDEVEFNFRSDLLSRCQEMFREREEGDAGSDEAGRRRLINNVHFIGKLFCKGMLPDRIIFLCLDDLLRSCGESVAQPEVESLCQLLQTVGQTLDRGENRKEMDQVFVRVSALRSDKRVDSRLGFLLLDVIDLRKNRWIPRRRKEAPKKIDEIRNEARGRGGRLRSRSQVVRPTPAPVLPNLCPSDDRVDSQDGWRSRASSETTATASVAGEADPPVETVASSENANTNKGSTVDVTQNQNQEEAINKAVSQLFREKVVDNFTTLIQTNSWDMEAVVGRVFGVSLERSDDDREFVNHVVAGLAKLKAVRPATIVLSLATCLDDPDDLVVDVPLLPKYVASFLVAGLCGVETEGEKVHFLDVQSVTDVLGAVRAAGAVRVAAAISSHVVRLVKDKGGNDASDLVNELIRLSTTQQ